MWRAFYKLSPWGDEIEDLRMGRICATIANAAPLLPGESRRAKQAEDYAFKFCSPPRKAMSKDDLKAAVMGINQAMAARGPTRGK
jgi:hypothetical protein